METKSWNVDLDGERHEVKLLWTYFGGKREVEVDGTVVEKSTVPMRWRSSQSFDLAGHAAVLTMRPVRPLSKYFAIALTVDGTEVEPNPGSSNWEASAS
jgi:hypothetical protein